jgi:hypothetical protein
VLGAVAAVRVVVEPQAASSSAAASMASLVTEGGFTIDLLMARQ